MIYSFGSGDFDAVEPVSALIAIDGALYGTSTSGGDDVNEGTIFRTSPAGHEIVLHSFSLFTGGRSPQSELVSSNGFLYGTTEYGGEANGGTIYAVTAAGKEFRAVHDFKGPPSDGAFPFGGLVSVNGTLYGTTAIGGASGYGTVFSFRQGQFRVIHSFSKADGAYPHATLTDVGGLLYGVTNVGGTSNRGVVFRITLAGDESVIHNFNGADGYDPEGRLIAVNGSLYGTTVYGGTHNHGTVFQMSISGAEKVLFNFNGSTNGCSPYAGLTAVSGMLYGATSGAGAKCNTAGTLFRISTHGVEKTLHTFGRALDGSNPYGGLLFFNKLLYGTTANGGQHSKGTVFSQSP